MVQVRRVRCSSTSLDLSKHQEQAASQYVNFMSTHAVPKAMTIEEVKKSTKEDSTLQKLVEVICSGEWKSVDKITDLDEAKVAELKLFSKVDHGR